jgi:hypothetical protein
MTEKSATGFSKAGRSQLKMYRTAVVLILVNMIFLVALNQWMDTMRPPVETGSQDESLDLKGASLKRVSMGFNGLVADWYWMRSLQYVGRKVIEKGGPSTLDDLGALNLKMLAPLLDQTTTIDPQFLKAYEYGAMILPAVEPEAALKLLTKGIEANPQEWILYHHLGYIHWQREEFAEATRLYEQGSKLSGAPKWMAAMAARLTAEGGSRSTAREMYRRIYQESDDENIRVMAELRLLQIDSFDARDLIRKAISSYSSRSGRCPGAWRDIEGDLRSAKFKLDPGTSAPLDPAGTPYVLRNEGCEVDLDPRSLVPYK